MVLSGSFNGLRGEIRTYLVPLVLSLICDLCCNQIGALYQPCRIILFLLKIFIKVAMIAPDAADRGIPVCEINLDVTPKTNDFAFHFHGKSGEILPEIVANL